MKQPFSEKAPPHNMEAEQSVLGAILQDRTAILAVRTELAKPEDFYFDRHGLIYQAAMNLFDKGRPVDLITVSEMLNKPMQAGRDETYLTYVGGMSYLTSLLNIVPTTANAGQYAQIVALKATLRRQVEAGYAVVDAARKADEEGQDLQEAVAQARAGAEVALRKVDAPADRQGLRAITGIADWAEQRLANMGVPDPRRIDLGFKELDVFAWRRGEVISIHAPSKNGKSTLTRAIAVAAAKRKQNAAYFSLEMGEDQIKECLISAEGRLNLDKIRNMDRRLLSDEDRKTFREAAERLEALPLYLDYTPRQMFAQIRTKVLQAAMKLGDLAVFFIDYAAIVADTPEAWQRHEQMLVQLHYEAQFLAREVNALAVIVDQAPLEMLKRANPTPTIHDFEGAKGIPKAVDHAIGLLIPPNAKPFSAGKNTVHPYIPVPVGDPMLTTDARWKSSLLAVYTAGRFTGNGFLMPLYLHGPSGFVGNLAQRPWEALEGKSGSPGADSPVEPRPYLVQQRFEPVDSF